LQFYKASWAQKIELTDLRKSVTIRRPTAVLILAIPTFYRRTDRHKWHRPGNIALYMLVHDVHRACEWSVSGRFAAQRSSIFL